MIVELIFVEFNCSSVASVLRTHKLLCSTLRRLLQLVDWRISDLKTILISRIHAASAA